MSVITTIDDQVNATIMKVMKTRGYSHNRSKGMIGDCVQGQFPRQPPLREYDELRERVGTAAATPASPRPR